MAKITQFAEFVLRSESVPAQIMAERVGLQPDESAVARSRSIGNHQLPRFHSWTVKSGVSRKSRLDDHFAALHRRLKPYAAQIAAVIAKGDVSAVLCVVRHFEPGTEDPETLQARNDRAADQVEGLQVLRGQHPLVGFAVDLPLIQFLADVGACVSFDEYADEYE